jgi:hypothetical protein
MASPYHRPTAPECETCQHKPWQFHKHADGSWRAPSRSHPSTPNVVWFGLQGWRCSCTKGQLTPWKQECTCSHVKCVKVKEERLRQALLDGRRARAVPTKVRMRPRKRWLPGRAPMARVTSASGGELFEGDEGNNLCA